MNTQKRIRSLSDLSFVSKRVPKILTLFSGGLDSTFVLKELSKLRGEESAEIICLTVDVGDGINHEELDKLAKHFGARSIVLDGRNRFANEAVIPAVRANAQYMGMYPISSSLSRPVIARCAVEHANKLGCGAIVHTANQSQNSLRRLNGAIEQLGFQGYFGTPYEFSVLSREEKIAELKAAGLDQFEDRGISGDANLWCREFESGSLDNPEAFWVPESLFVWTADKTNKAPNNRFSICFENGMPVAINGIDMPVLELIEAANHHVGAFQIGRFAGLEHLEHGEKVLEVREAPAAHILMNAYRHLEMAILDAELLREKISMEQIWVREAIEGRWFQDLRCMANSFIESAALRINGTVEYRLRQGAADVCSIQSAHGRYLKDRDRWEKTVAVARGSFALNVNNTMITSDMAETV